MTARHLSAVLAVMSTLAASPVLCQTQEAPAGPEEAEATSLPAVRVRVALNAAFWAGSTTYTSTSSFDEYVEQTTLRSSYETGSGFGPDASILLGLYRGFGVRLGFSSARRDGTGRLDVSRPHPLHFDRPRSVSVEASDLSYTERAFHIDAAFSRSAGRLSWSLFGGVTLFRVEADVFGIPAFSDVYPYDELSVTSTPTMTVESNPIGFNVGAGLDYRFGQSGRFGVGAEVLYSLGSGDLEGDTEAGTSTVDAGGLQVNAGLRIYF